MKKAIIGILVVLVTIAGLVAGFERTRKYVNARIDRKVAEAVASLKQQPAGPPGGTAADHSGLAARIEALEARSLGTGGGNSRARLPSVGDYAGAGAAVFGLFDAVGPYRKNGLVEIYGGSLRERRSEPVRVSEADLEITHDEAWLIWSPDYSPARDATHLAVEFAALPADGKITVGFLMNDGQAASYVLDAGAATAAPTGLLPPLLPEEIVAKANRAQVVESLHLSGTRIVAALPSNIILKLRDGQRNQIAQWFVKATGAAGTTLRFKSLTLIRPMPAATSAGVTLSGSVSNADFPPGAQVELVSESGSVKKQTLAADRGFSFTGVDPERPVSLRVRYPQLLHFATLGRWFVPGYGRDDIFIDLKPHYENSDGHAPDTKKAKFVTPRTPSHDAAVYESHARQYWPGRGKVQEYDSTTFTNNHGFVDRDRFFDNPDNCIRLASTGGSDTVALQVRPFEKFNIILEETLGVALGKCVEVISAGVDNGDLGANYPRIRDYFSKFHVAHTLVSTASALVAQVNPQMLRDGLGMDPENSPFPNFYFDKSGAFSFRDASPVYAAFVTKPTLPEYIKGIPFGDTLSVPFSVMPEPGKEAFRYWTEIVKYIDRQNPGQNFIFHSGYDQAHCHKDCESKLTLDNGTKIPVGAKIYVANLAEYCAANHFNCINPTFSETYADRPNLLSFQFDGHYSPLGHQWLAQELTAPLAKILLAASK